MHADCSCRVTSRRDPVLERLASTLPADGVGHWLSPTGSGAADNGQCGSSPGLEVYWCGLTKPGPGLTNGAMEGIGFLRCNLLLPPSSK